MSNNEWNNSTSPATRANEKSQWRNIKKSDAYKTAKKLPSYSESSKSKAIHAKMGERSIDKANRIAKKPESVFGKKLGEKLLNRNRGDRPYTKE